MRGNLGSGSCQAEIKVLAELKPRWGRGSSPRLTGDGRIQAVVAKCLHLSVASSQPGTTLTSQHSELPTVPSYVAVHRQFTGRLSGVLQANRSTPLNPPPSCKASSD